MVYIRHYGKNRQCCVIRIKDHPLPEGSGDSLDGRAGLVADTNEISR